MKALKNHTISLQNIYDYFGYEEKCHVIPIDDRTHYFWDNETDYVVFCENKKSMIWNDKKNKWTCKKKCNDFYTDKYFHEGNGKNIYFGKKFTMIVVDTRTDGNSFLAIYDNNKQL